MSARNLCIFGLLVWLAGCTFDPLKNPGEYPSCEGGCKPGCVCIGGKLCAPVEPGYAPFCCWWDEGCPMCTIDEDCPGVCTCDRGACMTPEGNFELEECGTNPTCTTDEDCLSVCACDPPEGICVPREETDYPDYCVDGPPECDSHHPCSHGCLCGSRFTCEPPVPTDYPDYCTNGPPPCEELGDCPLGCTCSNWACVPADPRITDAYCSVPANHEQPTCKLSNLVVTVSADEDDGDRTPGNLSLREALLEAKETDGTHRITFSGVNEVVVTSNLPPVPSATYIDGGSPKVRITGDGADLGLVLSGTGTVVSDLELGGFSTWAVVADPGARDIHLFRLQIGNCNQGGSVCSPNGGGIRIGSPAVLTERVFIGRGRELDCVDDVYPDSLPAYDLNVIVANAGDGIVAENVSDLFIYGTWVGFSNDGSDWRGNWYWANQGIGIHLVDVFDAVIGTQNLNADESGLSPAGDPLPAYVAVGRSEGGGVLIDGGGSISMPGLILGDTATMVPWDENLQFGLRISGNLGPVHYGPSPLAEGDENLYFCLINSDTAPPVEIFDPLGEVVLRGAQIQSFDFSAQANPPAAAIQLFNPGDAVKLYHLQILGFFSDAAIKVGGSVPEGGLEIANNLFYYGRPEGVPVLEINGDPTGVDVHHNVKYRYTPWCAGNCPIIDADTNVDPGPVYDCDSSSTAVPFGKECPTTDAGAVLVYGGKQIDVNGTEPGLFHGCAPDAGAFECGLRIEGNPRDPCTLECN